MRYVLAIIFLVSALTHFAYFGYPRQAVFDEVYFVSFAGGYGSGVHFFDIHPPLGKLILWASGLPVHAVADNGLSIGDPFSGSYYMWYRFLPTLFGVFIPLIGYGIARELKFSKLISVFVASTLILENSLLAQSRFVLIDMFLVGFGFAGVYAYLVSRRLEGGKRRAAILIAALLAAFAASVKWTGLAFGGLIFAYECVEFLRSDKVKALRTRVKALRTVTLATLRILIIFIVMPLAVYISIFAFHFYRLNTTGPGDAFMSPGFQKTLKGSAYEHDESVKAKGFVSKFIESNKVMFEANKNLASHAYGSKWYTWPYLKRPIYYWNSAAATPGAEARIYFIGNPFVYWFSFASVVAAAFVFVYQLVKKKLDARLAFLLAGYAFNFFPFALISRDMFLYHYLSALIFAVLVMAYMIDAFLNRTAQKRIVIAATALFLLAFLSFAPLTYGLPLAERDFGVRAWFETWR